MNFGEAIEAMKADPSKRFARTGWNGTGMFIYLTKGRDIPVEDWNGDPHCVMCSTSVSVSEQGAEYYPMIVRLTDHLDMRTADGTIQCGWLASQTDMLAEDWYEVN